MLASGLAWPMPCLLNIWQHCPAQLVYTWQLRPSPGMCSPTAEWVQIPLVGVSEGLQAAMMEDISRRAVLDHESLPSALFFTFLNTHQTLNCIAFSPDGASVAGASADTDRPATAAVDCMTILGPLQVWLSLDWHQAESPSLAQSLDTSHDFRDSCTALGRTCKAAS